jgi:hypothetical protein
VELMSTPSMSKRMPRAVMLCVDICLMDDGTPRLGAQIL